MFHQHIVYVEPDESDSLVAVSANQYLLMRQADVGSPTREAPAIPSGPVCQSLGQRVVANASQSYPCASTSAERTGALEPGSLLNTFTSELPSASGTLQYATGADGSTWEACLAQAFRDESSENQTSSSPSGDYTEEEHPGASARTYNSQEAHLNGSCKPCRFFQLRMAGCRKASSCKFCHFCTRDSAKEERRRYKAQRRRYKQAQKQQVAQRNFGQFDQE
ncbi:unnamed protein product [Effrenium voratum]|nr:unnamed protein product [Effrenium voratum]